MPRQNAANAAKALRKMNPSCNYARDSHVWAISFNRGQAHAPALLKTGSPAAHLSGQGPGKVI
jgi:hypothetical protein